MRDLPVREHRVTANYPMEICLDSVRITLKPFTIRFRWSIYTRALCVEA